LGREWEWEDTPEVTLKLVDGVEEAARLFNRYSPQFVASLIAENTDAHQRFFALVNAPFVANGFTRWVDGQYALNRPELGLSNWENGRLFARGGILSGDGVYTIRTRVTQTDPNVHR
jgi:glutamate-5-semialdehyde dehydrogenase